MLCQEYLLHIPPLSDIRFWRGGVVDFCGPLSSRDFHQASHTNKPPSAVGTTLDPDSFVRRGGAACCAAAVEEGKKEKIRCGSDQQM